MADLAALPRSPRARAALLVALLHILLAYGLLTGLGVEFVRSVENRLKVFAVAPDPPPPSALPIPAPVRIRDPEGAAAPPSLKSRPSPVVAPRDGRRSPVRAAPAPAPLPTGSDPKAGASATPGAGSGAGGQGSGAGAGRGGSGTGGGGLPVRAQGISGALADSDYPGRRSRRVVESVGVRFLVGSDGRVSGCTVTRSSGNARLDSVTCRLIEQRFRYRPARDANGAPVGSVFSTTFDWIPPEVRRP